jgi:type I restriction enzyme, S subunit
MSSEWGISRLDDLCSLIADCPHSTPKWTDSGVFVIRSWNVRQGKLNFDKVSFTNKDTYQERVKRAKPTSGDIVITREAPMGEVCMIPKMLKCCLGQRLVLLRPNTDLVDNRYLLFSLQSPFVNAQILVSEGTGSTVSNLRIPDLKDLKIPLPPLNIQQKIAEILSSLDDKIELNRHTNATLEAMAQTLFKEWFVKPITEGVAEKTSLDEYIEFSPKLSIKVGKEVNYIEMGDLPTSGFSISNKVKRPFTSGSKFQNYDTLLARITPCLENGKTGFVDLLEENEIAFGSTEFIVMRSKEGISPYFVYFIARDESFKQCRWQYDRFIR